MSSRRRPGEVRDAIVATMRERGGSATVAEIVAGVGHVLGGEVSSSSVRSYLNLNAESMFERLERGRYRLRGVN